MHEMARHRIHTTVVAHSAYRDTRRDGEILDDHPQLQDTETRALRDQQLVGLEYMEV